MDNFKNGAVNFFLEKYDFARDSFTKAIDEEESAINYLARAKVFMALEQFEDAYDDAQDALNLDKSSVATLKIKAEAGFNINEFETSLTTFRELLDLVGDKEKDTMKRWIRKCEAEISDSKVKVEEVVDTPAPSAPSITEVQPEPAIPQEQPKMEEEPKQFLPPIQIYHNYYQNVDTLTINILGNDIKNIPRENFNLNITASFFSFKTTMENKSDYSWEFEFFEDIVTSKTKTTYYPSKIEVICTKEKPLTWPTLEKSTKIVRPPVADISAPKYPSPYANKKDWDTLAKEQEKDELKEKEEGDGLNLFFQQLYSKADPDTRRAMQKSFSTSGGTVLSTNWKEVKQKDYENEIKPPSGLEFKKTL